MNKAAKLRILEKRILELELSLRKIQHSAESMGVVLARLNKLKQAREISHAEYEQLWEAKGGYQQQDWQNYYEAEQDRLINKLAAARAEHRAEKRVREERKNIAAASLALIMFIALISGLSYVNTAVITGAAVAETGAEAAANITVYFSVAMSANLTQGVVFGALSHNTVDNNATANYDGSSSASSLFLNVSKDSNVNLDFCLRGDTDFTTSGAVLAMGNMSWLDSYPSNLTQPLLSGAQNTNNSFEAGTTSVQAGQSDYYRFWLDVPEAQLAGDYNNSITFKYIQAGTGC